MNDKNRALCIVLAADDNYSIPLGITMLSILMNSNNPVEIEFFVLENKISITKKEQIRELVLGYGAAIQFFGVSDFLDNYNLPEMRHLNKSAYSRLFIPKIIDRKKVIYLDTDIIVNLDLQVLLNKDISTYLLAAVPEPESAKIIFERDDFELVDYFNSGVMLINIELWKQSMITEKALNFIDNYPEKIKSADQDVLNYVCSKQWMKIENIYNYEITYNEPSSPNGAKIIHYIGSTKPWHYSYPNNFKAYKKYADLSPWKNDWRENFSLKGFILREEVKFKIFLKKIPFLKRLVRAILNRS